MKLSKKKGFKFKKDTRIIGINEFFQAAWNGSLKWEKRTLRQVGAVVSDGVQYRVIAVIGGTFAHAPFKP